MKKQIDNNKELGELSDFQAYLILIIIVTMLIDSMYTIFLR